jgi:hypothetical protein
MRALYSAIKKGRARRIVVEDGRLKMCNFEDEP